MDKIQVMRIYAKARGIGTYRRPPPMGEVKSDYCPMDTSRPTYAKIVSTSPATQVDQEPTPEHV
ncbi:hypothetical protein [Mycoplana sp. MJR14]|jgi:hypothetical protein|uniref:hypothetical protein n=1 Tax=Mycoplana sp. MJR14 TaxID=3032583 RepID=UPI0011D07908|nr:hypothetical protein [Mycoplana sp. MJR14]MDF1631233.1 hypothetical protein [Mycoplana sp. MJR14]